MNLNSLPYQGKLVVGYENQDDLGQAQALAARLNVPVYDLSAVFVQEPFVLVWRDGCLKLVDHDTLKKGGLVVNIQPRQGEQRSWPAPKTGLFAQALGRKTKTVVDATTGWGQDSLHIFRMGYELRCVERSPVMFALLDDGFKRLAVEDWVQRLGITPPPLLLGNACEVLTHLETAPECIYIDPMFPTKRKKSALAKKSMTVLRELLGDDEDKETLLTIARRVARKRVVVKSPDYAEPLGGQPDQSFSGKLLRYDVYLN